MNTRANDYLSTFARSPRTLTAYRYILEQFFAVVGADAPLTVENYVRFLKTLRNHSPSTQRVYRTAVLGLYKFCKAADRVDLDEATKHYCKRQGVRVLNFDRRAIEKTVAYCAALHGDLLAWRDRAFVLLLAGSALRISEACALTRGDVQWEQRRVVVIGKGDKQAVVRVSDRALDALKRYLQERAALDGASRKALASLPLFAAHDIRAKKRVVPITVGGMWRAVKDRMEEAGLKRDAFRVHDIRHYAISVFYGETGDFKATQEFGRHSKMETTGRYTHLSEGAFDHMYDEVFNQH